MAERELNAKEVMVDVLSGVDDAGLMEKYKLSSQGLANLFEALVSEGLLEFVDDQFVIPSKEIKVSQVVSDIQSGFTGSQLMKKYRLSPMGLQTVLRKLVDSRRLGIADLGLELYLRLEANMPGDIREHERLRLDFEVAVCDVDRPESPGTLRDVSERGIGTNGIHVKVDEVKTLMILGDVLDQVVPFAFKARCRWTRSDESDGNMRAGFQILEISEKDLRQLRRLVELVTL